MTTAREVEKRSVVTEISRFGKLARRKDLMLRGCTSWDIVVAEQQGLIRKVARGYYALPGVEPLDVFFAQHQAQRACFSKATQLGLWVLERPTIPHAASASGHPIPGCVVHRVSGELTLMDVLQQCVHCGTQAEALVVLESAVVLNECTIPELRAAFTGNSGTKGRAIIEMIDPQSMSIIETLARYYLRHEGYNVVSQYYVNKVGHVDLLIEGLLGLETDGAAYHDNPSAWANDLVRNNMLMIEGLPCLRISAQLLFERPDLMLEWVRQALATVIQASQ